MPKSIESTRIDSGHHHHHHLDQPNVANNTSDSSIDRTSSGVGKKYRHQNYSKNIYIGTKNAEKWEFTRTKLAFKNDVEFVSYLLTLADTNYR